MTWRTRLRRLRGLRRFKAAQNRAWDEVVWELEMGEKQTHWMWFVFPQAFGLGQSPMSQLYGLTRFEAWRYSRDAFLMDRLHHATYLVLEAVESKIPVEEIFGPIDTMKFRSCMELFAPRDPVIAEYARRIRVANSMLRNR